MQNDKNGITQLTPEQNTLLNRLMLKMVKFDAGDPKRIQHFVKVASFARTIGETESLPQPELFTLAAASIVHDIGIRPAIEKHGSSSGKLQEQEGPAPARAMLSDLGFDTQTIERVAFLVGHHHTYDAIDGADYRILVEADFLVNLYENGCSENAVLAAREKVFRTRTGTALLNAMFGMQS